MGPCAKRRVTCTLLLVDGRRVTGENLCENPQPVCPRGPGEGYEKCRTVCRQIGHAEEVAVRNAGGSAPGAVAILEGHTYACQGCQEALQRAGVVGLVWSPNHK